MTQQSLFDTRADDAALRARAWARCCEVAQRPVPKDPVARADAACDLATVRIAYDLACGITSPDLSGNEFLGWNRGSIAGDAIEKQIRGRR